MDAIKIGKMDFWFVYSCMCYIYFSLFFQIGKMIARIKNQ